MNIDHPQDPNCTLEKIQADIHACKDNGYDQNAFAFTWITVQALVDKIKELENEIIALTEQ